MKVTDRKTVFEGRFLRVVEKYLTGNDGKRSIWETVERRNVEGRGAVVIIALTREGELIFEKNWRAPLESFVIQFPAGLTDVPGESEEDTARRELLEETGYKADKLVPIIAVPLAPALLPTGAMHFFAPNVEYTGAATNKDAEEIEVVKVPLYRVNDFLLNLPAGVELDLRVPGILWIMQKKQLI
jgi:ADP-ribose pyrophosphatase